MRRALTLLSLICCLAISLIGCGASKSEYTRRNQELLQEVPVFPGAELIGTESTRYKQVSCFESTPPNCGHSGYLTKQRYFAPHAVPEEVVKFFTDNMSTDWDASAHRLSAHAYSAEFSRQDARIVVFAGADGAGPTDEYFYVQADYDSVK